MYRCSVYDLKLNSYGIQRLKIFVYSSNIKITLVMGKAKCISTKTISAEMWQKYQYRIDYVSKNKKDIIDPNRKVY